MQPEDWSSIDYFTPDEFECPCCQRGSEKMDFGMVLTLDHAREEAGIPFFINSAYRCPDHNAEVGGVSSSAHVRGYAVDIACEGSRSRFLIVNGLLKAGFTRLGINTKASFIHVDSDKDKDQNVIWFYNA